MPSVIRTAASRPTADTAGVAGSSVRAGAEDDIRRTSAAPFLYSEADLTTEMRSKLTDSFRPPHTPHSLLRRGPTFPWSCYSTTEW